MPTEKEYKEAGRLTNPNAGGDYVDRLVRQFPILPSHLWIPVEYTPIEAGQYIVLFECGPQYTVAGWWPKDGIFTPAAGDPDLITHWMPLPVSLPNAELTHPEPKP